ncbi:peptidase T [Rossellomorea sp. YZS02]|uniref:peptidase T n=1 Tax=Rossellomorea sp. YZS02 TaxID=3097358 RepID=UPI002A16F5EE|nr:peptidase T [Rossellomorea sp. YZS02]MDX8342498.1 peptidase T [Rossellomorea sp. YZS02]
MKQELIKRLTRYVKVYTESRDGVEETPSTPGQLVLANMLVEELKEIGMTDVSIDKYGYVMATLPSNTEKQVPAIGFLAHVDTSEDFTGENVKPQLVEEYDGQDIVLHKEQGIVMSVQDFPQLSGYKGHTLMTTDGTTLLGADNKAGIAEIMTAMAYLIAHPEVKHGDIRVGFTPDEETGKGAHKFDVERFNAEFAYTVDGGPLGELEYESFNAAEAKITILGRNVHPGTAKGKMVNAAKIAMELNSKLPVEEAPESTDGYDGFFHLTSIHGEVEEAAVNYLIRDFDRESFNGRKRMLEEIVKDLQDIYGEKNIQLDINDQYFNMREKIEPVFEIVELAKQAMENLEITPDIKPIRGGTDGSTLSFMGLPTPNLFTGGENYHSRYEFASVDNMEKATRVIIEIVRLCEERAE